MGVPVTSTALSGVGSEIGGAGVVVVVDMFGGSPSNLSLPACARGQRRILYGPNMPALIKLAQSRTKPVAEAVALARDAGRRYIDTYDAGGA